MSTDAAPQPDPAMSSRSALVDFFSRSLTAFQSSKDAFRVVGTLPRKSTATTLTGNDGGDTALVPRRPDGKRPVKSLVVLDSSFNPPTLAHLRMAVSAIRGLQGRRGKESAAGASEAGAARGPGGPVRLLLLLAVNNADKKPKPAAFSVRLGLMYAFAADLRDELRRTDAATSLREDSVGIPQEVAEKVEIDVDFGLTAMPYFHDKSQAISDAKFYAQEDGEEGEPEQVYLAGYDTLIRIFNPKYYNAPSASTGSDEGPEVVAPIRRALDPFLGRSKLRITMRTDDEWGDEGEQVAYLRGLRDGGLEEVGGRGNWAERVEMVRGREDGEEVVSSTKVREAASKGDAETLGRLLSSRVKQWVLEEGLYRE
ncbi:cytidylyltransferase [Colletotrichum orchidophilum]|uniref:Cytidylyltransferase n=1 Tax=Colletotrichum orchidophilum TaxID=1209926 RepID=A0A1G4BM17_9PEZI|nr:cytidylyltransferase [Colletotrichum orchidophilum]OHF02347.1 cytidylyltransferase [Colletotrichum orchidophilum]